MPPDRTNNPRFSDEQTTHDEGIFRDWSQALLLAAILVGACSSAATSAPTQGVAAAAATPAPVADTPAPAAATPAPAAATPAPAAGTATVMAKTIGSQTVLVAGSNGMTVYTFTNDTAGSGKSACSGGCLTKWPALTVAAGATPTAGDGVTGHARYDHPRRQRHAPGHVQRPAALLLPGRQGPGRHQRQLPQLEPGQALTNKLRDHIGRVQDMGSADGRSRGTPHDDANHDGRQATPR